MFSVVSVRHSVRKGTHVTIIRNALDHTKEGSSKEVPTPLPPVMGPHCKGTTPEMLENKRFTSYCNTKECRISVRGETLYLTMLSAVTPM